jgi:hypothetical protein
MQAYAFGCDFVLDGILKHEGTAISLASFAPELLRLLHLYFQLVTCGFAASTSIGVVNAQRYGWLLWGSVDSAGRKSEVSFSVPGASNQRSVYTFLICW